MDTTISGYFGMLPNTSCLPRSRPSVKFVAARGNYRLELARVVVSQPTAPTTDMIDHVYRFVLGLTPCRDWVAAGHRRKRNR